MSNHENRVNALSHAVALASREYIANDSSPATIVAFAQAFADFLDGKVAEAPLPKLGPVEESNDEAAEPYEAAAEDILKCEHCAELSAALVAAGLPGLDAEVATFSELPPSLVDSLHEQGFTHVGHLLKLSPFEVLAVSDNHESAAALLKFLLPIKRFEVEREISHPLKSVSAYGDINLDQFSDLDPLTVKKLAANGVNTIGQLAFNSQALSETISDLRTPGSLALLGHAATCLGREIEARPELDPELVETLGSQVRMLNEVIRRVKVQIEADAVSEIREEREARAAADTTRADHIKTLKELVESIEATGTLVAPGVFAVDANSAEGAALLKALTSADAEQPLELVDGTVRIKGARINGTAVKPGQLGTVLARMLQERDTDQPRN